MKLNELLKQLNELDLQMKEPDGNPLEELVKKALAKTGTPYNEVIEMPKENLLDFANIMYEYGYEDGANSEMQESLTETMERFLSVEYNEAQPDKQMLVLYNGPTVVDSEEINLDDTLHTTDQEVREIAKTFWDNITDDIRVQWY